MKSDCRKDSGERLLKIMYLEKKKLRGGKEKEYWFKFAYNSQNLLENGNYFLENAVSFHERKSWLYQIWDLLTFSIQTRAVELRKSRNQRQIIYNYLFCRQIGNVKNSKGKWNFSNRNVKTYEEIKGYCHLNRYIVRKVAYYIKMFLLTYLILTRRFKNRTCNVLPFS